MKDLLHQSDDALVELTLRGQRAAFTELLNRHQGPVTGLIYQKLRDRHRTLDVSQEVFLKVFKSLPRYRQEGRFRSWILRIASNAATDVLREKSSRPIVYLGQVRGSAPPASEAAELHERREAVQETLAEIEDTFRLPLALRDIEGLSYEEIAEVTGLAVGTVKSRVHRGRERFRTKYLVRQAQAANRGLEMESGGIS
ncbi:MAG: sigma-70 family RNA polymerase sigma factor [Planctomycetota bacterium]